MGTRRVGRRVSVGPLQADEMYDSPDVDERYTDQARIHLKIITDDLRDSLVDCTDTPSL